MPRHGERGSVLAFLQNFLNNLDVTAIRSLVISVIASLVCIILHECAHGFAADCMGDHTARAYGRLSWNPLRHIDAFGLLMMVTVGVGWAKPVPVDARNFKHPKRGMAITALAGPVSNLLLAALALFLAGLLYRVPVSGLGNAGWQAYLFIWTLLVRIAVLSVGLGLFNLIPIPPLDGSKVLLSFLPDKAYFQVLRYERYVMIVLMVLIWFGVFDTPLNACIRGALRVLCTLTGFPPAVLGF